MLDVGCSMFAFTKLNIEHPTLNIEHRTEDTASAVTL
jgi:hypothetical protein